MSPGAISPGRYRASAAPGAGQPRRRATCRAAPQCLGGPSGPERRAGPGPDLAVEPGPPPLVHGDMARECTQHGDVVLRVAARFPDRSGAPPAARNGPPASISAVWSCGTPGRGQWFSPAGGWPGRSRSPLPAGGRRAPARPGRSGRRTAPGGSPGLGTWLYGSPATPSNVPRSRSAVLVRHHAPSLAPMPNAGQAGGPASRICPAPYEPARCRPAECELRRSAAGRRCTTR